MKNLIFGLICFMSINVFSQTGQIILKIDEANQVPVVNKDLKSTRLKIKSADAKLSDTFGKYNLTEFRQLYPSSKRPELLKYYLLETENHKELLKDL